MIDITCFGMLIGDGRSSFDSIVDDVVIPSIIDDVVIPSIVDDVVILF